VGAAMTGLLLGMISDRFYYTNTVGASGAIFGLLIAYAMYFPNRQILVYFLFPIPVRVFVAIFGGIALLNTVFAQNNGVADWAHLGGLVVGYIYLKSLRSRPMDELKYRYLRWKMGRARSKFDVYSGGRNPDDDWKHDWKKHIH